MAASIPAAITALLSVATSALPNVQIVEGELGEYVAAEQFILLDVIGQDEPATTGQPRRFNEAYGITCLVRTYAGNQDFAARRTRACAMYEAVRDGILTDPSLGNVVLEARTETYNLRTGITDKGGSASEMEFVVHISNQAS